MSFQLDIVFCFISTTYLVLLIFFPVIFISLYRIFLPSAIPGVPHNEGVTNSILGDIQSLLTHISPKKEIFTWLTAQNVTLKSPIIQVFPRPFSKPWNIVTNFRETRDILTRLTKRFDRSDYITQVFSTIIPHGKLTMKSTDARFATNRKLLQRIMIPSTLNEVRVYPPHTLLFLFADDFPKTIAPQLYKRVMQLIKL